VRNFAIIGVGGFVAPRHLQAIYDTRNAVIAATDPNDSVGILDRYAFDIRFFREIERFDRFLEKLRRGPEEQRVHYVSICSPNYLHDAHVRLALRVGAHAVCEKPLVINPWNLDALEVLEQESGRRVYTVLQLRFHPALLAMRERMAREPNRRHSVTMTYVTARGGWYSVSWKGSDERSGGVATNIGIHLFDLLVWLFGPVSRAEVHWKEAGRMAGFLELQNADVRWLLSIEPSDLEAMPAERSGTTWRSVAIDGEELEFTRTFADLHTTVYEHVLQGDAPGIADARPSIELVHRIRHTESARILGNEHPLLERIVSRR
jgi:UDP-N-acetyl-2-amino-2-deoxyglucuronate dehydrogenase